LWKPAASESVATKMVDELAKALTDSSLAVRLEAASAVTVYVLSMLIALHDLIPTFSCFFVDYNPLLCRLDYLNHFKKAHLLIDLLIYY